MWKRWIFRGVVGVALLMSVVGWPMSYWYLGNVGYVDRSGGKNYGVYLSKGLVIFSYDTTVRFGEGLTGFWRGQMPDAPAADFRKAGFAWELKPLTGRDFEWVGIPLWLVSVLMGLMFSVVWRKTKGRKSGEGFPVEGEEKG